MNEITAAMHLQHESVVLLQLADPFVYPYHCQLHHRNRAPSSLPVEIRQQDLSLFSQALT